MKEIKAIVQRFMADKVIDSLHELPHLPGVTLSMVSSFQRNDPDAKPSENSEESTMAKIEIVVPDELMETVIETIRQAAHTGRSGDGRIFIPEVSEVVKIRAGERGQAAI